MPFFHAHTFIEFVSIAVIYYLIAQNLRIRLRIKQFSVVFVILSVFNLIFLEEFTEFNSNQRYLEGILLLVIFFLSWFYFQNSGERNYLFLNAAFIIYFSGTLLVFILSKELFRGERVNYLWIIHSLLNIGLNISFAIFLLREMKLNKDTKS